MRTSPALVLCVLLSSGLALSNSASANHSWNDYHWARQTNPLALQVVDSVTSDWDDVLDDSLWEWNKASVMALAETSQDDRKRTRKQCRSVNGQMRVCNHKYGFNGWLGMASINLDGDGHIVRGVAKVNDSYSSYWADPDFKNHVMCQEIGHVLGLDHTSTDGSSQATCMDYSSDTSSQWPNAHDYEMLVEIYTHSDSYDSYDTGSDSDDGETCNAPPGKGCNKNQAGEIPPMGLRVHRGPGFEIWVAPGEHGTTWIHYVTLVPED